MRLDDALGACRNRCGRFAAYPSTGECRACYKARRRAGKPAPVANLPRKEYTYKEKRTMGRDRKKKLLTDGREAFLMDGHFLHDFIDAMLTAKELTEEALALGFSFEDALEYASANSLSRARKRNAQIRRNEKNKS